MSYSVRIMNVLNTGLVTFSLVLIVIAIVLQNLSSCAIFISISIGRKH